MSFFAHHYCSWKLLFNTCSIFFRIFLYKFYFIVFNCKVFMQGGARCFFVQRLTSFTLKILEYNRFYLVDCFYIFLCSFTSSSFMSLPNTCMEIRGHGESVKLNESEYCLVKMCKLLLWIHTKSSDSISFDRNFSLTKISLHRDHGF